MKKRELPRREREATVVWHRSDVIGERHPAQDHYYDPANIVSCLVDVQKSPFIYSISMPWHNNGPVALPAPPILSAFALTCTSAGTHIQDGPWPIGKRQNKHRKVIGISNMAVL